MTVIVIANDELECLKNNIAALYQFASDIVGQIIVVDNASEDGTLDWLAQQEGLSYIGFDIKEDKKQGYGKLIRTAIEEFQVQDDLLIIKAQYMVTPNALQKLQDTLTQSKAGAVGGMSNGFMFPQHLAGIADFETAKKVADDTKDLDQSVRVLGLFYGAVLIAKQVYQTYEIFSEQLFTEKKVFEDCFLHLITHDYTILYQEAAVFYDQKNMPRITDNQTKYYEDSHILMDKWGMNYFNQVYNENLIYWIDAKPMDKIRVMEVGCDCGATLLEIKNRFVHADCYGVELNPSAVKIASHFATITNENIEEENMPYEEGSFDYIIFGDVLEHLRNPLKVLQYCKRMIKPDGAIISSIPNIMHVSVMQQLLNGDFSYTDTGLLDRTHIHFFTYREIYKIFQEAGFFIDQIASTTIALSEDQKDLIQKLSAISFEAKPFMYEAFQYVLRAKIPHSELEK